MESNLFKDLLDDDNVNNYTKLYIVLSQLNYFKRYYIPNKLLENKLQISKQNINKLLKKFKDKGIIKVQYFNSKRYIRMNANYKKNIVDFEQFNYDWLDDN